MTRYRLWLSLLLLALSSGCASVQVDHVHDPEFDFTVGKTYRWGEQKIPRDEGVSWDAIDRAVHSVGAAELARKGFRVDEANPDFEIYYFVGRDEVNQISSHYGGHYYGVTWSYWGWVRGPGAYAQDARIYDSGSLTLDVVNAARGELVWRGTARGTIDPRAMPKDRLKSLEQTMGRLLAEFPPRGN